MKVLAIVKAETLQALDADEITVCRVRTEAPSVARPGLADSSGSVLLPEEERKSLCRDCERGEEVLLLDDRGVVVGLSSAPGVWSHAYDLSFWPCLGVKASEER